MNKKLGLILFTLLIAVACGQDFNSNSLDGVGNLDCPDPGNTNLCDSLQIIQKSCVRCHTGEHDSWISFTSKLDFINAGLIDPSGSIHSSPLITRLKRYASSGNMPLTPYTLSQSEYDILVNWVESP